MLITHRDAFSCMYLYKPCPTLRGNLIPYNYRIDVTVDSCNADLSFEMLASIVSGSLPDKGFIVSNSENSIADTFIDFCESLSIANPVYRIRGSVCAESLCDYIASNVLSSLSISSPGAVLHSIKLIENSKSYVTWSNPDNR